MLELLAAVCLVRGGHEIILAAFDNFKEVRGEWEPQVRAGMGGMGGDRTRLGWGGPGGHRNSLKWGEWGHQNQAGIGEQDPGNRRREDPRSRLG